MKTARPYKILLNATFHHVGDIDTYASFRVQDEASLARLVRQFAMDNQTSVPETATNRFYMFNLSQQQSCLISTNFHIRRFYWTDWRTLA